MIKRILMGLLTSLCCTLACAGDDDIRFAIRNYVIEGNSLLSMEEIDKVLQPFTGPSEGFETIQTAMATLEAYYSAAGFGAVKALLPEQDIEDGKVRLKIIEAKIGSVVISGNEHFSETNIRASLPALREGETPNMLRIDSQLRVANENDAKQTNMVLRRGYKDGEVDAVVKVADDVPLRIAMSLDNTGIPSSDGKYATGRYRTGLIVQHSNLFDRDHSLSMQFLTSPDHIDKVSIFGLGYRIPLYARGDDLVFAYGYSNVNSGKLTTSAGNFGISGSGQLYVARYNHYLPKWNDWSQKLSYGLDYKLFSSKILAEGSDQSMVPDSTVHPVSLTYFGKGNFAASDLSMSLSLVQNIAGGANGTTADFNRAGGRQGADANYHLWRYQFNGMQPLPADWMLRGAFQGQMTRYALVSGEQFGAGGLDSVRGFNERSTANDSGQRVSIELHTPDLGSTIEVANLKLRALAFYDAARLQRNLALPGEEKSQQISSYGLGLRGIYAKNINLRLDYGIVEKGSSLKASGSSMLHASIVAYF